MNYFKLTLTNDLVELLVDVCLNGVDQAQEECGLIYADLEGESHLWPTINLSDTPEKQFVMDFEFHQRALNDLTAHHLQAVYHSHVKEEPKLSGHDVSVMMKTGLDMVIVGVGAKDVRHYRHVSPNSLRCVDRWAFAVEGNHEQQLIIVTPQGGLVG